MNYMIDIDNDTCNDCEVLSLGEVAEQLRQCMAFEVAPDEKVGEVYRDGKDLVVDIHYVEPMDPRVDGCRKREEVFSLFDICNAFTASDYCSWAKDEDGDDVLLCFGC